MTHSFRLLMCLPIMSASVLLTGCGDAGNEAVDPPDEFWGTEAASVREHPYQPHFEAAAQKFNVPAPLLVALGYSETRLYHVPGEASEIEGLPATYGVMALGGDVIAQGAMLAGVSEADAESDPAANIMAAAALLDQHAKTLNVDRSDLGSWAPAVAEYFANPNLEAAAHFIHEDVYQVLRDGIAAPEDSGIGEILGAIPNVTPKFPAPQGVGSGEPVNAYYAGAKWRPSPSSNYTSGRSGNKVELLVVHTCAGSYAGCWGWLNTPYPQNPNKTSAHYVINESGSEISALVDEVNTAHHVGKSWQGLSTNTRSVGIEHGGFSYSSSNKWTEGQIAASAKLACDVVKRQGIVRDRNHIIGHYQPDPVNRANDPGTAFPWTDYMNRINACVGGASGGGGGAPPPAATITIDSNGASNNAAVARVVAPSANWKASTNVTGYYNSGYWVAPTAAVSDGVHFEFYLAAAGSKQVFAWWTSAADRATAVPYVAFNAAGTKLGSVNKNQQSGGGAWQSVGTFNFTAGWNRVTVSRWTTAGQQVVADAIQVR
jgi:N-acetylmuramoyl-L-alanine amidase